MMMLGVMVVLRMKTAIATVTYRIVTTLCPHGLVQLRRRSLRGGCRGIVATAVTAST